MIYEVCNRFRTCQLICLYFSFQRLNVAMSAIHPLTFQMIVIFLPLPWNIQIVSVKSKDSAPAARMATDKAKSSKDISVFKNWINIKKKRVIFNKW